MQHRPESLQSYITKGGLAWAGGQTAGILCGLGQWVAHAEGVVAHVKAKAAPEMSCRGHSRVSDYTCVSRRAAARVAKPSSRVWRRSAMRVTSRDAVGRVWRRSAALRQPVARRSR